MQKVDDSNPASRCANALICWPSSISGVRRRDETAIFLRRFRIRPGSASRERAYTARPPGPNNLHATLEDFARALSNGIDGRRRPYIVRLARSGSYLDAVQ
jgi:hypothetical protein